MATPGFIAPLRVLPTQDPVALAHQLNRVLDLVSQQLNARASTLPGAIDTAMHARVQALEARLAAQGPFPGQGGQAPPVPAATFQTLPDGPGGYRGRALQGVRVASNEAVLEYVPLAGGIGGAGVANQVAFWQNATTLTSEAELFYNSTTNRLGIGTSTPDAGLAVVGGGDIATTGTYGGTHLTTAWRFLAATSGMQHGLRVATTFHQNGLDLTGVGVRPLTVGASVSATLIGASGTAYVVAGLSVGGGNTGAGRAADWTGVRIGEVTNSGGGTVDVMRGLAVNDLPVTGVTSATGVFSAITAGANRWNLHLIGTAQNYLAGPLGIGIEVPTAPLTFGNALGPKIDIYNTGVARYGMGLQSGQMQLYAESAGYITLGHVAADGTTYTPSLNVGATNINTTTPVAVMWPIQASYELTTNRLYVAGVSRFNSILGIGMDGTYPLDVTGAARISGNMGTSGYAPEGGYGIATYNIHCYNASRFESTLDVVDSLHAYSASTMLSLRLGDHVLPGAVLDVNGAALVRGNLTVMAAGTLQVSGGGYLQVIGNAVYADGQYGTQLQGYATTTGASWTRALSGTANWGAMRVNFHHLHGVWAGIRIESDTAANYIDFRMSGPNAYMTAGAWVDAPSDQRVKTNVRPIGDPLVHLAKLRGCYYERTDLVAVPGFPPPPPLEYGLLAQDVAAALPEAAFEHAYARQGTLWNYYDRPVLALLVEAVKALAVRLDALEPTEAPDGHDDAGV